MQITPRVALEIAHHEGLVREAYKDSVGVWTWGVGLTNASGHNVERYIGQPASLKRVLEVYLWALENYAERVRAEFAGHDLTEAQFAAALSFHWNTGAIHRATWVDRWKAGDVDGAKVSFMAWQRPPEIIPRRRAERDLFFAGKWSNQDGRVPEWTRVGPDGRIDWGSSQGVEVLDLLEGLAPSAAAEVPPERPFDRAARLAEIATELQRMAQEMRR